ncbi:hypothetical protein ACUNIZ_08835 [Serratia sp. IR-2025]
MTRTLTTEQLRARIAHYRELAYRYGMSGNPKHEAQYRDDAAFLEELLANREAQPVAWSTVFGDKRAVTVHADTAEVWNSDGLQVQSLYTAPPAPAVPDDYFGELVKKARSAADKAMRKFPQPNYVLNKVAEESGEVIKAVIHYTEGREEWSNVEGEIIDNLAMLIRLVVEGDQVIGFTPPDTCRAAMLAQPVSSGYKLVPVEATEDMIAAAMNCDDVSFNADETFCVNFGNIYAAMLAAAPEGGN